MKAEIKEQSEATPSQLTTPPKRNRATTREQLMTIVAAAILFASP
jgi:hypothetical protein